ncbi:MAG: efflux RND transporter periplasmic adaptor subunit [Pseudomonadota bacterium]
MPVWKQLIGVATVAAVAVLAWGALVPASYGFLDRVGLLAPLMRLGVATVGGEGADGGGGAPSPVNGGRAGGPVQVIAVPVRTAALDDRLAAIGTARGVRSITLSAEISGQISRIAVASGEPVAAGAVVAELNDEAATIARDRAMLVYDDAVRTLGRLRQLQATGAATDLQLQVAELAERSAALEMRQAAYDLSRHRIVAPTRGYVGIIEVGPGDLVAPGTRIADIEDRSSLLVDFRVPERVASILRPGLALRAGPVADRAAAVEGTVSAVDNQVDPASRTLRVQATIANAGDRLRPGMAIALELDLPGERYPAVDPLAVQWGSDGAFVWVLRDGKAARLPVRILERGADAVLVEAVFAPGDLVVTEGMGALRPGSEAVAVEARDPGPPVAPVSSNG